MNKAPALTRERSTCMTSEITNVFQKLNQEVEREEYALVGLKWGEGAWNPSPYRRHARLLGPPPKEPNGPAVI